MRTPREDVLAIAATGVTANQIAKVTGLPRRSIERWVQAARRHGNLPASTAPSSGIFVLIGDYLTRRRLRLAARSRGLSEAQLIDLILVIIAKDDLYDAILDDVL